MPKLRRHIADAFTLMEALLAAVILAMVVTSILFPFTAGAQAEQTDARRTLAVSLAQELLEEILTKPFAEPDVPGGVGPETGETSRDLYDGINDYNGYNEAAGSIRALDGTVLTDPAALGLSRHATATYVYVTGQDSAQPPTFLCVTVIVRYKGDPLITLTRLVYNKG